MATELETFLHGHRIAFVGVSTSTTCRTRELFRGLLARGHEVIPIRPGVSEIDGIVAYSSVRLAGPLDGAVVVTARRYVERTLEECRLAGVRRIWLIGDDPQGEARDFASRHGIALVVMQDPIAALNRRGLLRRLTDRLPSLLAAHRSRSAA